MNNQILEIDKKIRERAKEIYDFVWSTEHESDLNISVNNMWQFDYYYIEGYVINFCESDYNDALETTSCPLKYFGDNWKELILEDSKLIDDRRIEMENNLANNKIESDKREYLRLKKMFEGEV